MIINDIYKPQNICLILHNLYSFMIEWVIISDYYIEY